MVALTTRRDWELYKQREEHVMTQGEDGRLRAEEGLQQKLTLSAPRSRTSNLRKSGKTNLVLFKPLSLRHSCGSPSRLQGQWIINDRQEHSRLLETLGTASTEQDTKDKKSAPAESTS